MTERSAATGPLRGVRIVEFAGIGPGPFASMLLSDMGADVVSIARPRQGKRDVRDFVNRGRRVIELDLKNPADIAKALDLIGAADVLIEGFRPQVMERLGLGPDVVLKRNPKLVYGRMTGWGQEGPLAQAAGHDINYIAITGALDSFRAANGETVSPLNLVGDYGGGALYLVVGVLAAVIEARTSGKGQVVDAAMCDGVSSMLTMFHSMKATGRWTDQPRTNLLDGGAPFYRTYQCKDGGFMAIGALEPQFYAELRQLAGLSEDCYDAQMDKSGWPNLHEKMTALFKTKTRDEWAALLEGSDACAAAVRGLFDAPNHPHLAARKTFVTVDGHVQPAPAPRFSRTPSNIQGSPAVPPVDAADILSQWSQPAAAKAS
ncbi:alpha-methylacyl-CoA racemase [Bradyrhizobiaceae bacterium SG-6C]|nr:alpha-methylacyl-CoA racemase [Bradyrhizobiaceae bacterium SG-6C]